MNWLDRAEAKYGHLAIPGLVRIIVLFNALVFVLYNISPTFLSYLDLQPALIMQGQVWRLVTYIFIPQFGGIFGNVIGVLLYLLFLSFLGQGLEQTMGAFRLNVYYFLGMLGVTVASFVFDRSPAVGGDASSFAAGMLNTSLLFAFARYAPDTVIYVMFILPAKIKWLAWFTAALLLLGFVQQGWDYRSMVLVCLGNYLLFFGAEHYREARQRSEVAERRRRFEVASAPEAGATLHECAVCKRTENSDPYLDFRVASDGQEYCTEHLPGAAPKQDVAKSNVA
jgi:hypothetical protein